MKLSLLLHTDVTFCSYRICSSEIEIHGIKKAAARDPMQTHTIKINETQVKLKFCERMSESFHWSSEHLSKQQIKPLFSRALKTAECLFSGKSVS